MSESGRGMKKMRTPSLKADTDVLIFNCNWLFKWGILTRRLKLCSAVRAERSSVSHFRPTIHTKHGDTSVIIK